MEFEKKFKREPNEKSTSATYEDCIKNSPKFCSRSFHTYALQCWKCYAQFLTAILVRSEVDILSFLIVSLPDCNVYCVLQDFLSAWKINGYTLCIFINKNSCLYNFTFFFNFFYSKVCMAKLNWANIFLQFQGHFPVQNPIYFRLS